MISPPRLRERQCRECGKKSSEFSNKWWKDIDRALGGGYICTSPVSNAGAMDCVARRSDQDEALGRTRMHFFYEDQARRAAEVLRPLSRKVWLEKRIHHWRVRALVNGDVKARASARMAALKAAYPK